MAVAMYRSESTCRACGSTRLSEVLSLGRTPLADHLLTQDDLDQDDTLLVPLDVVFCHNCALVQITETIEPKVMFRADYPYFSSVSSTLAEHSRRNADELIGARGLGAESFVLEIASNDGYMLRNFVAHGVPVLGVDPAETPARAALDSGIPTRIAFFGRELARELAPEGPIADVVIANNVLAHVADLNGLVEGIATVLKLDGVAVIEFPYLANLIDQCEFDTIYHQHLCYFSLIAVDRLFRSHRLYVNDVRRLDIHGGSLRLYVEHVDAPSDAVVSLLAAERQQGLHRFDAYADFANSVRDLKRSLVDMLMKLKASGARIAGYGAAAKGTTLLAYCGIGPETLEYIVDRNPYKQGRYMPGNRLPILPPERLMQDRPDYVLLLPWNFADEILAQQTAFRQSGGQFIVPIPKPKIV